MTETLTPKMSARNVNVYYGEKQAIQNVSIDVDTDNVTAFIGPSGCGKSTFLRTLNRMNDTVANARVDGEITLDGAPTTGPLTLPMPTGPGAATFHPVGHTGAAQCMITGQGVTTHLTFNGAELPCLQLWHDLRAGVAVQSIEPRNFLPDAPPPMLAPGAGFTVTQTLTFTASAPIP